MERTLLAIAKGARNFENASLTGGKELLASEFWRSAKIALLLPTVGAGKIGLERMKMRFVAGGNLQYGGLDLNEAPRCKQAAQGRKQPTTRFKQRSPVGVDAG
jgi:hypothetical protein